MNPFDAHQKNMAAYQTLCAEPVNGKSGNTIFYKSNVNSAGDTYPAAVGIFALQQLMNQGGGGRSPEFVMLAEVIVQKSNLPDGIIFSSVTGNKITATQIGGSIYQCQIIAAVDTYTEWRLHLQDVNWKA